MQPAETSIVIVRGAFGAGIGIAVGRPGLFLTLASVVGEGATVAVDVQGESHAANVVVVDSSRDTSLLEVADLPSTPFSIGSPPGAGVAVEVLNAREREPGTLARWTSEVASILPDGRFTLAFRGSPEDYGLGGAVLAGGALVGIVQAFGEAPAPGGKQTLMCVVCPSSFFPESLRPGSEQVGAEPPPNGWLRVTGAVKSTKETEAVARRVGAVLHEGGFGLIHGGEAGIDNAAMEGFVKAGGRAQRVVGLPAWNAPSFLGTDVEILGFDREVPHATFLGRALVVLTRGVGGVEAIVDRASKAGIPVIPFACTGSFATEVHAEVMNTWPKLAVPGAERSDYKGLAEDATTALAALKAILSALSQDATSSVGTTGPLIDDNSTHEDKLGMRDQARRMAEAIVAKDLTLPLAIGLLGQWGAGKSSFVKIMQREIDLLANPDKLAVPRALTERDPEACGRVVHIDFNAWHYVDTDLWASLAARLFDRLAYESGVETKSEEEKHRRRRELQDKLPSSTSALNEANAALAEATTALAAATKDAEDHACKLREEGSILDRKVLLEIGKSDEFGKAQTAVQTAGKASGLTVPVNASLAELERIVGLLRSAPALVRALFRPLEPIEWLVVGILIALPIAGVALAYHLQLAVGTWPVLLEFVAAAPLVLTRVRGPLEWLTEAGERVLALQDKARAIRESAASDPETAARVAAAAALEQSARHRVVQLEAAIAAVNTEIEQLSAGRIMYDFVRARSGEGSVYRANEGMVSRLRRDLEHLATNLKELSNDPSEPNPITRVVLYIDDLDRCPADKVVRVLQAVQLLVAVDLFVVVVAVDPRWLTRALEHEYAALLGSARGSDQARVSAFEYLEKIFQVPYSLAPITKTGFSNLVVHHFPVGSDRSDVGGSTPTGESGGAGVTVGTSGGRAEGGPGAGSGSPAGAGGSAGSGAGARMSDASAAGDASGSGDGSGGGSGDTAAAEATQPIRRYVIEDAERAFMERLWRMVDSPRALKRFMNVYRLLRGGVAARYRVAFRQEEYRAAQLFLAITIGYPQASAVYLRILANEEGPMTGLDLERALSRELDRQPEYVRVEYQRMQGSMGPFLPEITLGQERLSHWAREVGPYSFHWSWE